MKPTLSPTLGPGGGGGAAGSDSATISGSAGGGGSLMPEEEPAPSACAGGAPASPGGGSASSKAVAVADSCLGEDSVSGAGGETTAMDWLAEPTGKADGGTGSAARFGLS